MHLDFETRSSADITSCGAFKYVQDDDFRILLCAYKVNDASVEVLDLTTPEGADKFQLLFGCYLCRNDVGFVAYNAAFEAACLARHFNLPITENFMSKFRCTMIHAAYCGYPQGLAATGAAMGIAQEKAKLASGAALIRYFCQPQKPTKRNGGRTWNEPKHDPEKWEDFKTYCARDVDAEYEIEQRLSSYPLPEHEWALWRQETVMNAIGVRCDREFMEGARYCVQLSNEKLLEDAIRLTGLDNPNSNPQLLGWMSAMGYPLPDLTKATVAKALDGDLPSNIRRVLEIRQQLSKTSTKKYDAMDAVICADDRMRGLTRYYGAGRTGRWSGALVQLQNLTKHHIDTVDEARKLVKTRNYDAIRAIYGNVPDLLSQLVRTAIVPSEGRKFVVADFSAIEARVIAWLAGEQWLMDAFAEGKDVYCETASLMYHVPVVKGGVNGELRQKGKIAQLACGYGGGVNALTAMDWEGAIPEGEKQDIVDRWRKANRMITLFWGECETAMLEVVMSGRQKAVANGRIVFALEGDSNQTFLTIKLPSGRKLFYVNPTIEENRFGKPAVHYFGSSATTKKWERTSTYGGRCVENLCQSVARDCLAVSLTRIRAHGWDVVFHVHDEVVIDAQMDLSVDDVCDLMSEPIDWAPGLILKAAGFESTYYKKD